METQAQTVEKLWIKYKPHSENALTIHQSPVRHRVVNCGRRWGKSYLATLESHQMCLDTAMTHGRPARGWIVAPTYTLVMEMWRYYKTILKDVIVNTNKSDKRITLLGDHEVEFKSADNKDENLRGAGLDFAVLDEAARIHKSAWEEGIRPALSERQGRALFISTPKGRNWYYDLWVQGRDPHNHQFESWTLPTITSPLFPKVEWDLLQETMPQATFRQEFMAQFLEDSSIVFRGVKARVAGDFEDAIPGHQYVMGVDLAKTVDFTVIWILDMTTRHFVFFHRFQEVDWPLQKKMIYWKAKEYNNATISIDQTGVGDPIVSDLVRDGLNVMGYKFNNNSKKELVELGIIAIQQGWVTYPEVEEFLNEMMAFEYELLPSGRFRYRAPEGLHDDCVIAFLLALWPMREQFWKKKKEDKNKPPDDLDDRAYDYWDRYQKQKKLLAQQKHDPLADIS